MSIFLGRIKSEIDVDRRSVDPYINQLILIYLNPTTTMSSSRHFNSALFYSASVGGLEIQEQDTSWRPAKAFRSNKDRTAVVLWFGDTEYEGLGTPFTITPNSSLSFDFFFSGANGVLRDGEGDIISTRFNEATRFFFDCPDIDAEIVHNNGKRKVGATNIAPSNISGKTLKTSFTSSSRRSSSPYSSSSSPMVQEEEQEEVEQEYSIEVLEKMKVDSVQLVKSYIKLRFIPIYLLKLCKKKGMHYPLRYLQQHKYETNIGKERIDFAASILFELATLKVTTKK